MASRERAHGGNQILVTDPIERERVSRSFRFGAIGGEPTEEDVGSPG